jgi:signal transduction histidine kinase
MSIPGGIRAKLMLALVAIVGGALAGVYLIVVPSLERQLVDAKLDLLARDAESTANAIVANDLTGNPNAIRSLGAAFGARMVLYTVVDPSQLAVSIDTAGTQRVGSMATDPIALEALQSVRARGTVTRGDTQYAEVATQLFTGEVLLLSGSLTDQLSTVQLVKRRLLIASLVAIFFAMALGAVAAGAHARRIQRLERAALRIAEGSFDEPIVDLGDDELGELAATFDEMRVQLRQLDTARKEFVANASHELRTPLFSLAGFLELMADEDLDDETRGRFLQTTREQVERLSRTAATLLDLSRIDTGRLHVEREDVDLQEIAAVLAEELGPLGEQTRHHVEVASNGEVWALADEERVLQIGRALAANAITHTPEGSSVRLEAKSTAADAMLIVEDDGPGISTEHLDRVFDRFYRADASKASGSGLGLAIARELALRMGGSIAVESRPGRTRFLVSLPAAADDADAVD